MSRAKEIMRTFGSAAIAIIFFFILYKGMSFEAIPSAVLAVAMYAGAYWLLKPGGRIGKVQVETIRGGEDSLKLMEEAKKDIRSLEKNLDKIEREDVKQSVEGLTSTGRKILVYLTEHPDKITGAHRFADYYLDMAEKLVDKYVELEKLVADGQTSASGTAKRLESSFESRANFEGSQADSGLAQAAGAAASREMSDSVASVLEQTREALSALNGAFRKQQDRLMEGDLMEIETDIKVLKETLKMEGDS